MTGPFRTPAEAFEAAKGHIGHKVAVTADGEVAQLVCVDCCEVLESTSRDFLDGSLYQRWACHRDPADEALSPEDYKGMDPDDEGFPEHHVVMVGYGRPGEDTVNVAFECEPCGTVLADWEE